MVIGGDTGPPRYNLKHSWDAVAGQASLVGVRLTANNRIESANRSYHRVKGMESRPRHDTRFISEPPLRDLQ